MEFLSVELLLLMNGETVSNKSSNDFTVTLSHIIVKCLEMFLLWSITYKGWTQYLRLMGHCNSSQASRPQILFSFDNAKLNAQSLQRWVIRLGDCKHRMRFARTSVAHSYVIRMRKREHRMRQKCIVWPLEATCGGSQGIAFTKTAFITCTCSS